MSGSRELPAGVVGTLDPRPGRTYLLLRWLWRLAAGLLGFRVEVAGLERLPAGGGWIAAGLPHRVWIDPFLLWGWLPVQPRLVFFGDAATMSRSPLRRWVIARLGGVVPIPTAHAPGQVAVHLAAALEALAVGAVFCLFPETGAASVPGRIRRLGGGVGYIALRSRAPIVPLVIGGNDELFLGRRIILHVLEPLDPWALAGLAPDAPALAPGSPAEREAVRRLLDRFALEVARAVEQAHHEAEPPAGARRPGRWLTTLFR